MAKKVVHLSGTRKRAVARATVKEGKGIIRVNKQLLDSFMPAMAKLRIQEPLIIAGDISKKVDINVNVFGGGWQSQAEAIRLVVAKGLVEFTGSKALRKEFLDYDRHLLVADVRRNEPHKPNDSKPRAKRQASFR